MERDVNKKARALAKTQTGEERRNFFLALKMYRKARKYAKRLHLKKQLNELETLKSEDPRRFWQLLQNLKEGGSDTDHSTKIPPGEWYDHLVQINKDPHPHSEHIQTEILKNLQQKNFDELDFAFSLEEIKKAIQALKNNKTTGLDRISNEMIKSCNSETLLCLKNIFNKVYLSEEYPNLWCQGYVSNIHKKGSYFDPQNYRHITITSSLGKLFNLTLNNRLQTYIQKHNLITPQQIGFEKGSSTVDHIFTLKTIIDKYTTKSQKLYTCFVDYKQAFDRIWHQGLLLKLTRMGINNNLFRMINSMYSKIELQIKHGNSLTNKFTSTLGVRQGDNLSPTLFNLYINDLHLSIQNQRNTDPITIGSYTFNSLFYADDVVLISTSSEGLQNCITALKEFSDKWKLEVNLDKTKVLTFNNKGTLTQKEYKYGTDKIQQTDKYTYLGIDLDQTGTFKQAITTLQNKGLKALYKIQQLTDNNTNINTLLNIFDHTIKPILTYGSEVWGVSLIKHKNINNKDSIIRDIEDSKINQLELKFYKQLLRVKRNTTTIGVRGELGRHPIGIYALSNSLKYLNTLQAKPDHKLAKQALLESKKLSLNNNKTWYNIVTKIRKTFNIEHSRSNLTKHQIKKKLSNNSPSTKIRVRDTLVGPTLLYRRHQRSGG